MYLRPGCPFEQFTELAEFFDETSIPAFYDEPGISDIDHGSVRRPLFPPG